MEGAWQTFMLFGQWKKRGLAAVTFLSHPCENDNNYDKLSQLVIALTYLYRSLQINTSPKSYPCKATINYQHAGRYWNLQHEHCCNFPLTMPPCNCGLDLWLRSGTLFTQKYCGIFNWYEGQQFPAPAEFLPRCWTNGEILLLWLYFKVQIDYGLILKRGNLLFTWPSQLSCII